MKKRNIAAMKAGALILGTMLVSSVSAKTINNSTTLMDKPFEVGLGQIEVDVKLIYGSSDLPQIIPFPGVEITAVNMFDHEFSYSEKTDRSGECYLVSMKPGLYKVKAERDGHVDISSGLDGIKIVRVKPGQTQSIEFTLTEEGSPWDETSVGIQGRYNINPLIRQLLVRFISLK